MATFTPLPSLTGLTFIRELPTSGGEHRWAIERIGRNGSPVTIVENARHPYGLFWRRDGTRLFYDWIVEGPDPYHGGLASVRPDGTDPIELIRTEPIYDPPALSIDGRWVAFGGDGGEPGPGNSQTGVEVLDLVRGSASQITQLGGTRPIWSPDGVWLLTTLPSRRVIVFDRSGRIVRSFNDPAVQAAAGWTADGRAVVWNDSVGDVISGKVEAYAGPTILTAMTVASPDSGWFAVVTQAPKSSRPSLYVGRSVSTVGSVVSGDLTVDGPPTWSPDGAWLAFAAADSSSANERIFVASRNGSMLIPVTDGFNDSWPAWQPSGT